MAQQTAGQPVKWLHPFRRTGPTTGFPIQQSCVSTGLLWLNPVTERKPDLALTFSDTVPFKACPPLFASCSPVSLRSASNQPQKRFSWFQQLSPWRISTILYAAILTPMSSTLYFRELGGKWLLLKGSRSNGLRFSRTSPKPQKFLQSNRPVIAKCELEWWKVSE